MGKEERKEGENDGVPSYDESIQGHRERERKKERGGERRKKTGVPSYEQPSRDTPRREWCT